MAKIKPKDLKTTDVLMEKTERLFQYARDNRKKLFIGAGIAAGIILFILGWYFYHLDYEKRAQKMYAAAYNSYHFTSSGSADVSAAIHTIGMYREVAEKFPGSRAAAYANLGLGNLYYRSGDMDHAVQSYQDFLNSSVSQKDLKALAYSGLGYSEEAKGKLDKAIEAYGNAVKDTIGGAFTGVTYMNIARIYEKLKNDQMALEYYRKASEQKNNALIEAVIKRKIADLDS
jgi:tetratricopeptide (TPR) repeat protein